MNKLFRITALIGSLWGIPALAADNAVIVTPGSGLTIRSIDIGAGVQAPGHALVDAAGGQLGVSGAPLYVRVPSAAIASGAYASGAFASGAFASGSVASGAFASGALASGSIAAGAMVDLLTMRGTVGAGTGAANSLLTGCIYNSTPITLSNGQGAAVQCNASGYPTVVVSNTLAAVTPGDGITTTVYGTAPASPVIGAPLLWNGTTYDRWKSSGSTGIAAAGLFQGSSALSATNGIFSNVLQGNAVLSATNGLFSNILQGNAVLSATNPTFARATDGTRAAA